MTGRRLNHVEFAHRPGEGALVVSLFEALGCSCSEIDTPPYGKYIVVSLDGSPHGENDMFVTEAEPEQLALEHAIDAGGAAMADARTGLRKLQKDRPYRATHIGIRLPSVAALDAVIARLDALRAERLSGRVELGYTETRSAEEARDMSSPMKQIWVWTDVISTGLLLVGQQIELQAYAP